MNTKDDEVKGIFNTGAGLDYRTEEQEALDWRPEEAFAMSGTIDWREKTDEEVEAEIKASCIPQNWTLRCVSEYAGIFFEWINYIETGIRLIFSRRDIYTRRSNRPYGGMSMPDLFKLMREGACFESDLPSTAFYESEINQPYTVTNKMKETRSTYGAGASFTWSKWTIDDLARTIQGGIPVCLFWYFDNNSYDEWWNKYPIVRKMVDLYANDTGRHQATGVAFRLINGVKNIVVMDSAGTGTGFGSGKNLRNVSEAFIKSRNYGAGFAIDKKNLDYKPEPTFKYTFNKNLKYGDVSDDVKALQEILVLEGCLVLKNTTRNYLGMTQSAVKKLQEKYASEILHPLGLKRGTGNFANSTRAFINKKYSA